MTSEEEDRILKMQDDLLNDPSTSISQRELIKTRQSEIRRTQQIRRKKAELQKILEKVADELIDKEPELSAMVNNSPFISGILRQHLSRSYDWNTAGEIVECVAGRSKMTPST